MGIYPVTLIYQVSKTIYFELELDISLCNNIFNPLQTLVIENKHNTLFYAA
jgi:hypothetical protein